MINLFIIGNGFDRAHCLPTSYSDFYKYLLKEYPGAVNLTPSFSNDSNIMPDGKEVFDEDEVVAFIIDVINEAEGEGYNWSNVESSLGKLNFEKYFNELSSLFDVEEDKELFRMAYRYEDVSNNFLKVVVKIKKLFSDWINSLNTNGVFPKTSFQQIISEKEDLFLNFNYTMVLEELYEVENICYIHGKQFDEIIFGHGEHRDDFENIYTGSSFALAEIHSLLMKNTNDIIDRKQYFFERTSLVNNIYSYGFSFSEVDLPYINEICKRCNSKKQIWYLQGYEPTIESLFGFEQRIKRQKSIIKQSGFKGEFEVFNI